MSSTTTYNEPKINLYPPLVLRLNSFILTRLMDPDWVGTILFDKLKQHTRGRVLPTNMLYETIQNGLLYHICRWLIDEFFDRDYLGNNLQKEYRLWFFDDCVNPFERFFPDIATSNIISSSKKFIDKIDALYDGIDDCKYFRFLNSEKGIDKILNHYDLILDICNNNIEEFYLCYAQHCAEHIFHDRQLCAFVSESLVSIGFDGMDNPGDIEPKKWIERKNIPEWAKKVFVPEIGDVAQSAEKI